VKGLGGAVRYYVLCRSDVLGILPYIVAEIVHDAGEADDERGMSLAGTIAGARSTIATRLELMGNADTLAALREWESQDDSEFDRETAILGYTVEEDPPPSNVIPLRGAGSPRRKRASSN
jgi:hypothetical protein